MHDVNVQTVHTPPAAFGGDQLWHRRLAPLVLSQTLLIYIFGFSPESSPQ